MGGGSAQLYNEEFFNWWARVTFCVDEYYYARMDFHGDPDLPLSADAQWGDIGVISFLFISFVFDFLHIYNVFGCASIINMCVSFLEQMLDLCTQKGNPDICEDPGSQMLESQIGCFARWRGTWTD